MRRLGGGETVGRLERSRAAMGAYGNNKGRCRLPTRRLGPSPLLSTTTGGAGGSLVSCALPSPSLRPLSSLGRLQERSGNAPDPREALCTSVGILNLSLTTRDALETACKRK